MTKLSIITCTYNSEKYLQDCIDNVKSQNLNKEDFEHIFVDANSTDKTKEIIEKYKEETGFHIYIYEQNPKGVYAAMNYGAKKSTGEYLMWLNSDDFLEKNILKKYINFVNKTGNKDLYYGVINNYKDGKISVLNKFVGIREFMFRFLGSNTIIYHPTVLMLRKCFFDLGGFNKNYKISADYDMRLKVLKNDKTMQYFPYVVSNFRVHDNSLSSKDGSGGTNIGRIECGKIQKEYFPGWKISLHIMIYKIGKLTKRIIG